MQHVIIRPLFTEKSMQDAASGRYTFLVEKDCTKDAIKIEVEKVYKVTVEDIATVISKGKGKRVGKKRTKKVLSSVKKAVVQVAKGQKIAEFDLGEKK